MTEKLTYYIHCFTHLKRDAKNGGAPHKPILLLSVIQLFEQGIFNSSQIFILPELVSCFKSNWSKLVSSNHHAVFAMPFYHMNSEPFWNLIPNVGCEKWIESKSSMRSLNNLTTAVNFALIDIELSELLLVKEYREVLKISILEKYFPKTNINYSDNEDNRFSNPSILNESSEVYVKKIIELKNKLDENAFQEEVFIRGGIFKREIPKIYNNTCAISGLRIDSTMNIAMIDACHIVPFSDGYNDTIINGIALCPNFHRAFDRGLISISDDYRVILKKNFIENNSVYNLSQFNNQTLQLPEKLQHYPDLENIRKHRKRFNFP